MTSVYEIDHAIRNHDFKKLNDLIKTDYLLNYKHEHGYTFLHHAVLFGHFGMAKILINKGIDINAQTTIGYSCMHFLSKGVISIYSRANINHIKYLEFFIDHGAELNLKTIDGYTPLDLALLEKDKGVIAYLKEKGARQGEEL